MNSSLHELVSNPSSGVGDLLSRRVALGAAVLSLALLGAWLLRAWLRLLTFDDAYMFYRYADNVRHGLGISWNPDGVPTFGLTSLLWMLLILPLTAAPLTPGHALRLASWLVGGGALLVMTATVARRAQSTSLRFPPLAFAAISLPLLLNPVFAYHLTTGMDTMLSVLANAALVWGILEYAARPSAGRAFLVGSLGFVAILARPDSGVCALGSSLLAWLATGRKGGWRDLLGLCVLPVVLVAGELLVCKSYFQVPLPLGFYAKSLHSYAGFLSSENAVQYAYMAGLCALPFAAVLGATLKRAQAPLVAAFLLPAAATVFYLLSVRQVMGFVGRYYIPLIPFVAVPALLSADVAAVHGVRLVRRIGFGVAVAVFAYAGLRPIEIGWEESYAHRVVPKPFAVPDLPRAARGPLQRSLNWFPTVPTMGQIIADLPAGAVVAASEVGYISCAAPRATIIDLVGLNDTDIGAHGFSMDHLLARAPDLIWFPHSDYTGLRATILSDRRLFKRYVVITDAFNFGIAIRRDSPLRADIERGVRAAWSKLYPSSALEDYVVADRYTPSRED